MYKIIGMRSQLEIAEMCARSGANCGSLFLDLRFRELMKTLLADHPVHLDSVSLANFMEHFSETEKLRYMGEEDDGEAPIALLSPPATPSVLPMVSGQGAAVTEVVGVNGTVLIGHLQIRCSTSPVSTSRIRMIPRSAW